MGDSLQISAITKYLCHCWGGAEFLSPLLPSPLQILPYRDYLVFLWRSSDTLPWQNPGKCLMFCPLWDTEMKLYSLWCSKQNLFYKDWLKWDKHTNTQLLDTFSESVRHYCQLCCEEVSRDAFKLMLLETIFSCEYQQSSKNKGKPRL